MGNINKSIMQADDSYCYIHKKYLGMTVEPCHKHHALHGTSNRKWAEKDGLYIFLCNSCHQKLHDQNYHDLDIQQEAERIWLKHYGKTVEEWIQRYIRNYL